MQKIIINRQLKIIIFCMAITAACLLFPHTTKAIKLQKTQGNVSVYTYNSSCANTNGKEQTIILNTTANPSTVYFFQHGDGRRDWETYCNSFGVCKNLNSSAQDYLFVGFQMDKSIPGEQWAKNYDFKCLYNEAEKQVTNQLNKKFPSASIISSYSRGGKAVYTLFQTGQQPASVSKTIFFDSCYSNDCTYIAGLSSGVRGIMLAYTSSIDDANQNATKNKAGTEGLLKNTDQVYVTSISGQHQDVPANCFFDFILNNSCNSKAISTTGSPGSPAAPLTPEEIEKIIIRPNMSTKLPGLDYSPSSSEIYVKEEEGSTYLYIPFLGQYVAALFKYLVVVGSIIAVVLMINGGLIWIISAGSPEKIKHAQQKISGALFGFFLLLLSYTVLYSINPELVKFKNLKVKFVHSDLLIGNESVLPDDFIYLPGSFGGIPLLNAKSGHTTEIVKNGKVHYGYNGVPYFAQYDEQWAKLTFGNKPVCTCQHNPNEKSCGGKASTEHIGDNENKLGQVCCTDIAHGGCNVTSYAMVLRYHGKDVDPAKMAALAIQSGARVCNGGITSNLNKFHKAIEAMWPDIKIEVIHNKHDEVLKLLYNKQPIITHYEQVGYTSTGAATKPYEGHFIVYTGTDGNLIYVNDPGRRDPSKGIAYISKEQFKDKDEFIYIKYTGSHASDSGCCTLSDGTKVSDAKKDECLQAGGANWVDEPVCQ